MHPWPDLKWWDSGERQAVEEKIDDLERQGVTCNPEKHLLYKSLQLVREEDCKVCIIGQDPYPNPDFATGVAFSIPKSVSEDRFPATLRLILKEYVSDTHNLFPNNGCLELWAVQGVLLWNAIPSVQSGHPLSNDWHEWDHLTSEIVRRLSERGVVFALLGSVARDRAAKSINERSSRVITTGHPSVRGNINSKTPFTGSRIFTTINAYLCELGKSPVDWSLEAPKPVITGEKKILPNVNNIHIGGLPKPRLPRKLESTFSLEG